jgi:hypothetical protein
VVLFVIDKIKALPMSKYTPKLDPKTGQFIPIPKGEKPPKMKVMEEKLDLDFIEDYKKNYLNGDLGQKRFARRWGVSKNQIFANNLRGGRRSWFQMLGLEKKGVSTKQKSEEIEIKGCEICGEKMPLERAHWKEYAKGGSAKAENILNLCPNCHTKLDGGNKDITEKGREILLFRETQKILDGKITNETPKKLLDLCTQIISERRID